MKASILVVDDDFITVTAYSEYLEERGYSVARAFDGFQALQSYETCRPDLLITDIKMPRMDGLYLVRALRAERPSLPVIIATGSLGCEAMESLKSDISGPLFVLHKPVSGSEMADLADVMLADVMLAGGAECRDRRPCAPEEVLN